jgi:hypothetical protein
MKNNYCFGAGFVSDAGSFIFSCSVAAAGKPGTAALAASLFSAAWLLGNAAFVAVAAVRVTVFAAPPPPAKMGALVKSDISGSCDDPLAIVVAWGATVFIAATSPETGALLKRDISRSFDCAWVALANTTGNNRQKIFFFITYFFK